MSPFRFAGFIAVLLCGTQAAGCSALRWTATFIALGAIVLARRIRAILLVALACGSIAGLIDARLSSIGNPQLQSERVLVVDRASSNGVVRLRLRRDAGSDLEAWIRPEKTRCDVQPGTRISISGEVEPFDGVRNPGGYAPADAARERGVAGRLHAPQCEHVGGIDGWAVAAWPARLRNWGMRRFNEHLSSGDAAMAGGVLLGIRSENDEAVRADFVATGTVHVLVTAGLHIGIVVALIFAVLRSFAGRNSAAGWSLVAAFGYAVLTGWHLPARRAAIISATGVLAIMCGTVAPASSAYFLAAAVVVVLDPTAPERLSFWLSFCCVGALLAFTAPLANRLRALPGPLPYAVAVSLAAQIGTWPLIAYGMHTFGWYAVPANLVIVPLTGILLAAAAGFLATIAGGQILPALHALCAPLTDVFALLCRSTSYAMIVSAHFFAALPGGTQNIADPPIWCIILYYALCTLAVAVVRVHGEYFDILFRFRCLRLVATRRARTRSAATLIGVAQLILVISVLAPENIAYPRVTMLDAGQGDAFVLQATNGHCVVIDTGGKLVFGADAEARTAERAGEAIVMPFLAHARIRYIDILVLTHPHADHTGAAARILREYTVGMLIVGTLASADLGHDDAVRAARARHIPVHVALRGENISFPGGTLQILSPFAAMQKMRRVSTAERVSSAEVNEHSIVLLAKIGMLRMLCMGDAGMPTEAVLRMHPMELRADILKIGHHGSDGATSTDFLAAVRPRVALISAGRNNLFGHPAPGVIFRLAQRHITTLRTDHCGAVTLEATADGSIHGTSIVPCAAILQHI